MLTCFIAGAAGPRPRRLDQCPVKENQCLYDRRWGGDGCWGARVCYGPRRNYLSSLLTAARRLWSRNNSATGTADADYVLLDQLNYSNSLCLAVFFDRSGDDE